MGSFVGAGAVSSNAALAPSTNMSVAVHASTVDDDTLILIVHKNDNDGDVSTPAGWDKETTLSNITGTGDDRTIAVFTRPALSEPSSYNIQHTDTTSEEISAVILTYRGFSAAIFDVTPISAHVSLDADDFTPNPIPTITTLTDGAFVVTAVAITLGTLTSGGAPTGYNDRVSHLGTNRNLLIADKEIITAGAEDPVSWNSAGSGQTPDSTLITFALEPVTAGDTTLVADPSELTFTGATAGFTVTAAAIAGALTFIGADATLTTTDNVTLLADPSELTLSGADANTDITMVGDAGTLTFTGAEATFTQAVVLTADPGSLVLSGSDAVFAQTQLSDPASLVYTGAEATLSEIVALIADPTALLFTGADATLIAEVDVTLTANPGTLIFIGAEATLNAGIDVTLIANPGSLLLTGSNATLVIAAEPPPVSTPTTNYTGKIALDLAEPGDIKDPATYRAILFLHDAVEQLSLSTTTRHDELSGITPNDHHPQVHDFFGGDHFNKPEAITTLVSLTTKIGNIIICNNIVPIIITLHPIQVSDPVTIVRANIGRVTIDGDGALIMGQPTQILPLPGDAADLIGTDIGWKLT